VDILRVNFCKILRAQWFCDFENKPLEIGNFEFVIFLQKKSQTQNYLSPPRPFSSRMLVGEVSKPLCAKYKFDKQLSNDE
jgi:hypothetical protein